MEKSKRLCIKFAILLYFFCFYQFYAFLPHILYNYSKIFMHKLANIHFLLNGFLFSRGRAPNNSVLKTVYIIV